MRVEVRHEEESGQDQEHGERREVDPKLFFVSGLEVGLAEDEGRAADSRKNDQED